MVVWSGPSKRDLRKIYDYIALDSRYYAKKVANDIVDKAEALETFPSSGRIVPEINHPNIREVFIYSYRLIYEMKAEKVVILAIVHGRRDFPRSNPELLNKKN